MKVYIAFQGDYEQREVAGVYTSKAAAERAGISGRYSDYDCYEVEEGEPEGALLWTWMFRLVEGRKGPVEESYWHEVVDAPAPLRVGRVGPVGDVTLTVTGTDRDAVFTAGRRLAKAHDRSIIAREEAAVAQHVGAWRDFLDALTPDTPDYLQKMQSFWDSRPVAERPAGWRT